jgi:hypothetical protein
MNTPQRWSEIGFEVEITGDGSPSLRISRDLEKGESMHHSGGAAEETELIYGRVIKQCFQRVPKPHFLSVGLGLGYVELTVAREALLNHNTSFTLESFELIPELKEYFMLWLKNAPMASEITQVYDQVLKYILKDGTLNPQEVKDVLLKKWQQKEWLLQGALEDQAQYMNKAHGVLFDAFSAKTTPVLWTEEFLVKFFNEATAADSLISTYASRTALKNAMRTCEIQIEVREGFKSKRNSTLGRKGQFQISAVETLAGTSSHIQ